MAPTSTQSSVLSVRFTVFLVSSCSCSPAWPFQTVPILSKTSHLFHFLFSVNDVTLCSADWVPRRYPCPNPQNLWICYIAWQNCPHSLLSFFLFFYLFFLFSVGLQWFPQFCFPAHWYIPLHHLIFSWFLLVYVSFQLLSSLFVVLLYILIKIMGLQ